MKILVTANESTYQKALRKFGDLLEQAKATDMQEPTAMTLATVDEQCRPSVRTVLLKGFDERGFVFFTNLNSRKGKQLALNKNASLCIFWQPLKHQISIEGAVETVSDTEADTYWETRPRDSQIGAWASQQSEFLDSRKTLEKRVLEYRERYKDQPVPRPPHWSGFRLVPDRIEFWKSGWSRLHERECYLRSDGDWTVYLLNP